MIQIALAAILFASGVGKYLDLSRWRQSVARYRLPFLRHGHIAFWIPLLELCTAVGLGLSLEPAAAIIAFVLFSSFAGVLLAAAARGATGDCDCFGEVLTLPIGRAAALRAVGLALVAALIPLLPNAEVSPTVQLPASIGVAVGLLLVGQVRGLAAADK